MQFKVYDPAVKPEKTVSLKLTTDAFGDVICVAVDENGKQYPSGKLFEVMGNGTISRCTGVNPDLGLPLDYCGRIQIAA